LLNELSVKAQAESLRHSVRAPPVIE